MFFQLISKQKLTKKDQASIQTINRIYIVSCGLNAAWLVAWQFKIFWLSIIIMAALLISLISIMREVKKSTISRGLRFWLNSTFGFYLGWIMVATIANITVLLVNANWEAFGNAASWWAVGIVSIGALIGSITALSFSSAYISIALVWAYIGILIQHLSGNLPHGPYDNVLITVCISLVAIGICGVIAAARSTKKSKLN
ncbi:MAG: hypothetical protein ACK5MU_00365 [Candidatus Saccharimonadales bacterium]